MLIVFNIKASKQNMEKSLDEDKSKNSETDQDKKMSLGPYSEGKIHGSGTAIFVMLFVVSKCVNRDIRKPHVI